MADSTIQKRRKKWNTLYPSGNAEADALVSRMAQETGLSEITARLLYLRGHHTAQDAMRFFRMEETTLHDPFLLKDMPLAVERLSRALERREKIAIYGDYDVDGVTSVSLLYLYLTEQGGDVTYYIPSRSKEGYGLSAMAMDRLHAQNIDLIVTVDTGITAASEAAYAAGLGMDMIITDHHECRAELPKACAVVNPHRPDDTYPFSDLAGVGVAFKLACAFEMAKCRKEGTPERDGVRRVCRSYADLVALGTIADVMPVTDENRLIISLGLHSMEEDCRLGLQALMDAAAAARAKPRQGSAQTKTINSTYIGFTIAPRINAAGRVSSAAIAAELLLSTTRERADELAEQLCALNAERQAEENRIAEEAYRKIEEMPEQERRCVVVLDDDHWHQGVIGIVSSRVTERCGLPSILITYDGSASNPPAPTDVGKGSGRSIKGLNLVEALTDSENLLVRYGGHELAAGLSIRRGEVDAFRKQINAYAEQHMTDDLLCVSMDADCEVSGKDLTMALAKELECLEPFGVSNPVPCFLLRDARLIRIQPMGGGKHLRLTLEKDGSTLTAVWFGTGIANLPFEEGDGIDLLFQLNINEFQNTFTLQLVVQDAQPSAHSGEQLQAQIQRFEAIRMGADFTAAEQILPDRADVAAVYTFLRREARAGRNGFSLSKLLKLVRQPSGEPFGYCKLKFILRIIRELRICNVTEPVPDHFQFDSFDQTKVNLESSSILQALRRQLKN